MDLQNDIPKYRKKSKSSQSNSKKRSDHKHQYEKVIIFNPFFGFCWGKRCSICGRTEYSYHFCNPLSREGLMESVYVDWGHPLDLDKIRERYPDIDIYEPSENGTYKKVERSLKR